MENLIEFIEGRIKENNKLFSEDELNKIYNNNTYIKVYVLGLIDSAEIDI